MIEVNDIGEQVATAMQYDLEYDNLVMASVCVVVLVRFLVLVSLVVEQLGCENN